MFDPRQSQAHTLVATALVASFATTAIAQDWWLEVRYYIESRTSQTPPAKPNDTKLPSQQKTIQWLLGLGGTWLILSLMVDLGVTAELAEAFALVIMGSVLMTQGPQALANLGFINQSQATEASKRGG